MQLSQICQLLALAAFAAPALGAPLVGTDVAGVEKRSSYDDKPAYTLPDPPAGSRPSSTTYKLSDRQKNQYSQPLPKPPSSSRNIRKPTGPPAPIGGQGSQQRPQSLPRPDYYVQFPDED
ncbi:hypothetical protein MGG_13974 [Pyricularia oryzae 70-15]|uniref:Uncharacterized protein n=2 Tax=Pyricularia oryzae TaxID=318829 RepID=G4NAQ1_PYRO7|nr:uncharacterized protein MGG_13974 [Pyricularia oryzae 70-15]EHA49694.1 hypothetical protein MGG_13974 [Pyricularia oryzae 70-15]KAI7908615.1 hypothetical protein M0657_012208 [Pyricularia oryzae]KAI7908761.1 hypothetical protein M9X92_012011 [Pyricularia oryzae]